MEFDSNKATDSDGIPHVLLRRWIVNSVILSTPYSRNTRTIEIRFLHTLSTTLVSIFRYHSWILLTMQMIRILTPFHGEFELGRDPFRSTDFELWW